MLKSAHKVEYAPQRPGVLRPTPLQLADNFRRCRPEWGDASRGLLILIFISFELSSNSKITNSYFRPVFNQYVIWLQVHMQNPCFMQIENSFTNLKEEKPDFAFIKWSLFLIEFLFNSVLKGVIALFKHYAEIFILIFVNVVTFDYIMVVKFFMK